jgi:hypothetical protein
MIAWLAGTLACAPPYSPTGNGDPSSSDPANMPELNDEVTRDRINGSRVHDVLPESGTGDPISWGFDEDEPKEITVVHKQVNGTKATIVLDIKTRSSTRANILRFLAGQIRTEWELQTGLVTRRWEIVRVENISMKYKDVPKASPTPKSSPEMQNANR